MVAAEVQQDSPLCTEEVLKHKVAELTEKLNWSAQHGSALLARNKELEDAATGWRAKEKGLRERIDELENEVEGMREKDRTSSLVSASLEVSVQRSNRNRRSSIDLGMFSHRLSIAEEWEEERKELEKKNAHLRADAKRFEREKHQFVRTIEDLKKEHEEIIVHLASEVTHQNSLEGRLSRLSRRSEYRASENDLQDELETLSADLWAVAQERDRLRSKLETMHQENHELYRQVEALQSECETHVHFAEIEKRRATSLEHRVSEFKSAMQGGPRLSAGARGAGGHSGGPGCSPCYTPPDIESLAAQLAASGESESTDGGSLPQGLEPQLAAQAQAEALHDELDRMRRLLSCAREEAIAHAQEMEEQIVRLTKERDELARRAEELGGEAGELRESLEEVEERLGQEASRREEEIQQALASLQQDLEEVRSRLVGVHDAQGDPRGAHGKVTDLEGTVTLLLQDCEILHIQFSKVNDALSRVGRCSQAASSKSVAASVLLDTSGEADEDTDGPEPIPDNLLCKMHGLEQDMEPFRAEVSDLRSTAAQLQETAQALEDSQGQMLVLQGQLQRAEKTAREMDELRKKAKESWSSATQQCKELERQVAALEQDNEQLNARVAAAKEQQTAAADLAESLRAEVKQLQAQISALEAEQLESKGLRAEVERLQEQGRQAEAEQLRRLEGERLRAQRLEAEVEQLARQGSELGGEAERLRADLAEARRGAAEEAQRLRAELAAQAAAAAAAAGARPRRPKVAEKQTQTSRASRASVQVDDAVVKGLQEEVVRLKQELEQATAHGESAEAEMLRTLAAMRRMDREFVCVS